jgi:hypothetical protein
MKTMILGCALLWSAAAFADPPEPPPHQGPRRPLPEAAFTACANLKEGDACTAKMRDHERPGTCFLGHEERLWCRPQHAPPPPPQQ